MLPFPQKLLTENHVCVYMKQTSTSIETYQLVGSRILTWSIQPLRSIILIQNIKVMEFSNAGDFNKSTVVTFAKVIPLCPSLWGCPGHNLHRSTCSSQQALGPLRPPVSCLIHIETDLNLNKCACGRMFFGLYLHTNPFTPWQSSLLRHLNFTFLPSAGSSSVLFRPLFQPSAFSHSIVRFA